MSSRTKKKYYPSLQDASTAIRRLDIKSTTAYFKLYKIDPMLPANPWTFYSDEWTDWYDFFDNKRAIFYATLGEASDSIRRLGIKTLREYRDRYKEDLRLPSELRSTYIDEWKGWREVVGEIESKYYIDLNEASFAAQKLLICSPSEYLKHHKEDPKLPIKPSRLYRDEWTGWFDFLAIKKPEYYKSLKVASVAAQKLSITSSIQYRKRYCEDLMLPATPKVFYKKEWTDWYEFLSKEKPKFYKSLKAASIAAHRLGIVTSTDYVKLYKGDSKLPLKPNDVYSDEWVDWYHFLENEKPNYYKTFRGASVAAQRLGIKDSREYLKRFKEDKKLPIYPRGHYKKWTNWYDFLGTERKVFYKTLKEASDAAQILGALTQAEYYSLRARDSKLPHAVYRVYSDDWDSWANFLGIKKRYYKTFQEASTAVQNLSIKTSIEYHQRYKEDSLLPPHPRRNYVEEWSGWRKFLENGPKIESMVHWEKNVELWLKDELNIDAKQSSVRFFVENFKVPERPELLLAKDYVFKKREYESLLQSQVPSRRRRIHTSLVSFFDWILETKCSDEDDGELVVLEGFKNPFRKGFKIFTGVEPNGSYLGQSNKPVLSMKYIKQARLYLFPMGARNFLDVRNRLTEIFTADWFDVEEKDIDKSDPDCIYRVLEDGLYQLWNPSRAVAVYMLLQVPLRGQQILWLDSGEGDKKIPCYESGNVVWKVNTLPTAGLQKGSHGVIQKTGNNHEGMYITTNKTSTRLGGYSIPYIPDDLTYWLVKLRNWQSKYNTLDQLIDWVDIRLSRTVNKKILKSRGAQAFLFRDNEKNVFIPSSVFSIKLAAVLYQIQGDERMAVYKNGVYKSKFTAHSIRVSLITAYVVDDGIPIHIISKLVGHSSIVMTIYYTKVGAGQIRKELAEAEKRAMSENSHSLQDMILDEKIEQARGELIAKDDVFFSEIDGSWPAASYQFSDKGICAMGGAACDIGGYGEDGEPNSTPVPQGYLGRRNCVRCRYFITGPAFIGGLMALANELSLEVRTISNEYSHHEACIKCLEDEKYDYECEGKSFLKKGELSKAHCHFEEKAAKLDVLLCDLFSTNKFIKQSIALINEQKTDSDGQQLIVSDSFTNFELRLEECKTDFRLLTQVCENASIYSGASASRALPKRSQMLDQLADMNGLRPVMYRLTEEQQLIVGNQLTNLLISRIESWENIDRILAGDLKIDDLNNDETLEPLSKSVSTFLEQARQYVLNGSNQ